jgi:hypothetical protein
MAAGDGLVSMKPSSIAYSGTSAGINADGGVDFTAVTELSLNGVFTSDYDNYLFTWTAIEPSGPSGARIRWRASGTDNSTASSYVTQKMDINGTSQQYQRYTTDFIYFFTVQTSLPSGVTAHVYGPALAQPTAYRTVGASSESGAFFLEYAATHNQSVSYDGFTIYNSTGMTGNIHVFGYEE